MSRYWVFHEQRLKGPLEPEGLRALTGFTLDMRVCPEGGPETDWRPAREHEPIVSAIGRPEDAAGAAEPLPAIPKLAPIAPAPPPPIVAVDDPRVWELERKVAVLEAELAALKKRLDERSAAPASPPSPIAGEPALLAPPPFSPLERPLEPAPDAPPPFALPARKLRVLAADDDELMRQAIAAAFRKEGHDIEVVADGKTALERVASSAYDVVILDEGMPGGSGFQVARAVSKLAAGSRPKILIFTAQYVGSRLARETFLASGADDVLSKEVGMFGLLKRAIELTTAV